MTILNAWIEEDRALIASNTEGKNLFGVDAQLTKILTFGHSSCAIGVRGPVDFLFWLSSMGVNSIDFDDMVKVSAEHLEGQYQQYLNGLRQRGMRARMTDECELAMVGWSPARGRMWGEVFKRVKGDRFRVHPTTNGSLVAPWESSWGVEFVRPDSRASMLELASIQKAHSDSCGGRLVLIELRKDSIVSQMIDH